MSRLFHQEPELGSKGHMKIAADRGLSLHKLMQVLQMPHRERLSLVVASLVLLVHWVPVIVMERSAVIAGERYWWIFEDGMISMRYARNLAHGIGLVWNPGERVEGYTNFLWTVFMAVAHLLPLPDSKVSIVVLVANVFIGLVSIPLIFAIVRSLGGSEITSGVAAIAFGLNLDVMYWATFGIETTLLGFFLLLGGYRLIRDWQSDNPSLVTYLFIAIIALIRADGFVISFLLYAVAMVLNSAKKQVLAYTAISLLLPASQEIFRIMYYGDVLPNTAYLKVSNWDGRLSVGLNYTKDFVVAYALLILLAIVGVIKSQKLPQRFLFGVVFVYVVYITYAGGDVFYHFRFFVPIVPLLVLLAFLGLQSLVSNSSWQSGLSIICLVAMPWGIPLLDIPSDSFHIDNLKLALYIKDNTPANTKLADTWGGTVFYFSERYGIDILGKSDRYIAHLATQSTGTKPGHNKFDYAYSLGIRMPDYVVANFKLPVTRDEMIAASTGDWAYAGQLYFDPLFQKYCLPNPLSGSTWRSVFRCDWSLK